MNQSASTTPTQTPVHKLRSGEQRKTVSDAINDATLTPLVTERSAGPAVIRAQILLCRAHFSVGQIDGSPGTNFRRAVLDFQASRNIPPTGSVNKATWKALNLDHRLAIVPYRITAEDVAGPFEKIPNDWAQMAKLAQMGYESVDDELGERFHSNPGLLHKLNPNKVFDQADTEIMVPDVGARLGAKAASLVVSKSKRTVIALNNQHKVVALFPASTGSEHDPLPIGVWKVTTIHYHPTFSYNPDLFWDSGSTQSKELIAPGPRGPVGVVWIGISKEHYGIHGTAVPSDIGHTQSHGCIRMTNWDAMELAKMVGPGTPVHLVEE
ncbi:MAG TPA: L,D-transpeptidase family protein [Bryobacteraceae bacterium]|nr:L,D-transpeptidase family protein [Bryobacteraceae bacterium]